MSNHAIDPKIIQQAYLIFIHLMLKYEGDTTTHIDILTSKGQFDMSEAINMPPCFLPLIYASSTIMQMSSGFLPYYLQQQSKKEKESWGMLHYQIANDAEWFSHSIYPELSKILFSNAFRIVPCLEYDFKNDTQKNQCKLEAKVIIFDSKVLTYKPFNGIDIQTLRHYNLHDDSINFYCIGNISAEGYAILKKYYAPRRIFKITPPEPTNTGFLDLILKWFQYFSKTPLAGFINIHLPLIVDFLQKGLSPISFYYLLFHTNNPQKIIQNSYCLLNQSSSLKKNNDDFKFKKCFSYLDLEKCNNKKHKKYNYLFLIS